MSFHGHSRADLRNLALHRAAFEKLSANPSMRAPCLMLLERWLAQPELSPSYGYLKKWRSLLTEQTIEECARVVLDERLGQGLRQSSPLGPVLTPRERWAILAEVNRSFNQP